MPYFIPLPASSGNASIEMITVCHPEKLCQTLSEWGIMEYNFFWRYNADKSDQR